MEEPDPNIKLEYNPWINLISPQTIMEPPRETTEIIDLTLDSPPPSPISPPTIMNGNEAEAPPTTPSLFHSTLNFGSEKMHQFIASGIPQAAAKQVCSAALTTSLFVAKTSLKVAQTTASYGFAKLKESVIPDHVADYLSANKKGRRRKTKWEKVPKEVCKWCRAHPKELKTMGYVAAGGMLVYNPTLLVGALGMQRKAVLGASVATKVKRAVSIASSVPVALQAFQDIRKGGIGRLGTAAMKLAMRKTKREKRGRKKRS
ncbi:hypothetical protein HYALB_00012150 [Hymenoscyphus albidus]|uniref:Uncharacterized protein n=1 Tax=Hymenoscyphus albidus TaxID=595503 RepID=A0A9N9PW07_9HELO|nr:hypothetical protein HYALB_00012150 [Hymenoscyphus albidus]